MTRIPLALSNWKMAISVAEGLAFVRDFQRWAGDLLTQVDVVICPPFTALWPIAQALSGGHLQLGGQNMAPVDAAARTGEVSAALLADAGCRWVMLGHWEVRRNLCDDDVAVNRKVRLALDAGLAPIVLVGEAVDEQDRPTTNDEGGGVQLNAPTTNDEGGDDLSSFVLRPSSHQALDRHLARILAGVGAEEVTRMAFVYEPEAAIGQDAPSAPARVAAGCGFIRGWVRARWGDEAAERVRVIYGGSVSPEHAGALLAAPDIDGLGASRRGRDPATFAAIVRQIARVKLQLP